MKLAIADPPYPPIYGERRDRPEGPLRLYSRSRAVRWYGGQIGSADYHPAAGEWDDIDRHRQLLLDLTEQYDGWAIATTPDGLGAYHPLPVSARIMVWHRQNGMPGGSRILSRWEPVIVFPPENRRARTYQEPVSDVLSVPARRTGFAGAKPPEWTRWVLSALGYDPEHDEVTDVFQGSGAVSAAADGMLL